VTTAFVIAAGLTIGLMLLCNWLLGPQYSKSLAVVLGLLLIVIGVDAGLLAQERRALKTAKNAVHSRLPDNAAYLGSEAETETTRLYSAFRIETSEIIAPTNGDGELANLSMELGNYLYKAERAMDARRAFARSASAVDSPAVRNNLAVCHILTGDIAYGRSVLVQLIQEGSTTGVAARNLSTLARLEGELRQWLSDQKRGRQDERKAPR
jgi:hypothetical protein